jgi:hypothetical protein
MGLAVASSVNAVTSSLFRVERRKSIDDDGDDADEDDSTPITTFATTIANAKKN